MLGQFLPVLAMLGGALSKNGAIASLKAAGAAMTAARTHDQEAVDKAHNDFTSAMEDLKTQWEMRQNAYQDARDNFADDRATQMAKFTVLSAQSGDELGLEALRSGNLKAYHDMRQAETQAGEKLFALMTAANGFQRLCQASTRPVRSTMPPSATAITGQLPPLGMGKAATGIRQKIIERAAQMAEGDGAGSAGAGAADSDVGRAAGTKADTASLANITKIADSAAAYEDTAKKNFDTALSLAKKGIPTDMGPWINNWVQNGETALGDPNIPPYAAALLTGANEYAKVMSVSRPDRRDRR